MSEVLEDNLGNYSSIRDVEVISGDGESQTYDLLMALNQGILSQNPNIHPDDTIVINRVHREIQVRGEVYKPGTYQLLDGEGIADVMRFTGGFTPMANTNRIKVDRYSGVLPSSFAIDNQQYLDEFEFHNGDIITVSSIIRTQPVVYVEGAVSIPDEVLPAEGAFIDEYDRIVHYLNEGETLYDILDSVRGVILPFAALEKGYVLRSGESIPVNMQNLIYRYRRSDDMVLEPFDHIIIPINRPMVYVTGAAYNPGFFPIPPRRIIFFM